MRLTESNPVRPSAFCAGCTIAAELARAGGTVICECGQVFGVVPPVPGRTLREVPPPGTRPVPREAPPEQAHAALVELLCELRPDNGGPFGWSPYGVAPTATEGPLGALAERIRVQATSPVPAILPGAFAAAAGVTRGTVIARALAAELERATAAASMAAPECEGVRAWERGLRACVWLQRHGTLGGGAAALYAALAAALARPEQRARWRGGAGAARGAVAWGAARVGEAVEAWAWMRTMGGV